MVPSCESPSEEVPDGENPYTGEVDWNGFVIEADKYQTPKAFMENWGINGDNLSANFDLRFTDGNGTFDSYLRQITKDTIQVYFDTNSPDFEYLGEGTYTIEPQALRKPFNIIEAFVLLKLQGKQYKFPLTEGKLEISREAPYVLINYTLITYISQRKVEIKGQYTGIFTVIDQRLKTK
jgi:hypothetical protein